MSLDKLIVVTKKTALEELLLEHATASQARFYLESRGKNFSDYLDAHVAYREIVDRTVRQLPDGYRKQVIDKSLLSTHQFDDHDIILVVGDPGLFVNVAKYTNEQPVISINGDPGKYEDVFTTCGPEDLKKLIPKVSESKADIEALTMAEATLDDGQRILALNDLFIGRRTHVSARYILSQHNRQEAQSSSGIVVSTGTGSTAWMKAILAGAYAISGSDKDPDEDNFSRESAHLLYFIREPFPTKTTGCEMVTGRVSAKSPLSIVSSMTEEGVIFSDGIENDYISFNAGASVTIKPAENKVLLVKG